MADIIPLDMVEDDTTSSSGGMSSFIPLSDVEDDTGPVYEQPSWGQSARYVGKSILEGGLNTLKLAAGYNPLFPQKYLTSEEDRVSTQLQSLFDSLGLSPETEGVSGVVPEVSRAGLNALASPGGPVGNFAAGAGAKIGEELFPESALAPILGSFAGAGGVGAANKVADVLEGAGQAFERSSVGAAAKHYVKSQKATGLFTDEEAGEVSTRLSDAISNIAERDGLGLNRSPEALAIRVKQNLADTGEKIGEVLGLADR